MRHQMKGPELKGPKYTLVDFEKTANKVKTDLGPFSPDHHFYQFSHKHIGAGYLIICLM